LKPEGGALESQVKKTIANSQMWSAREYFQLGNSAEGVDKQRDRKGSCGAPWILHRDVGLGSTGWPVTGAIAIDCATRLGLLTSEFAMSLTLTFFPGEIV
jgi:hypothetical protein